MRRRDFSDVIREAEQEIRNPCSLHIHGSRHPPPPLPTVAPTHVPTVHSLTRASWACSPRGPARGGGPPEALKSPPLPPPSYSSPYQSPYCTLPPPRSHRFAGVGLAGPPQDCDAPGGGGGRTPGTSCVSSKSTQSWIPCIYKTQRFVKRVCAFGVEQSPCSAFNIETPSKSISTRRLLSIEYRIG